MDWEQSCLLTLKFMSRSAVTKGLEQVTPNPRSVYFPTCWMWSHISHRSQPCSLRCSRLQCARSLHGSFFQSRQKTAHISNLIRWDTLSYRTIHLSVSFWLYIVVVPLRVPKCALSKVPRKYAHCVANAACKRPHEGILDLSRSRNE